MTHHISTRSKRGLALVGAGALTASLALGGIAHAGAASTASTRPANQGVVSQRDLLHRIDVMDAFHVNGRLTSHEGSGDGAYALTACSNELQMRDVVGHDANRFYSVFIGTEGEVGRTFLMPQHIADQATVELAIRAYNTIDPLLRACQHEPAGHWHYGIVHYYNTGPGLAMWMIAIDGDGTRNGGVILARAGRHVAVVDAKGGGTFHEMQQLVADTVARLH